MYLYSARLRTESVLRDHPHLSLALQERLNGLSAAINALYLVHSACAWINPILGGNPLHNEHYPSKKAKKREEEQCKYCNDMRIFLFIIQLILLFPRL